MKQKRPFFILLPILLLFLVACDAAIQITPTPFPTAVPITPLPSQSLAPTTEELLANPETYQDNLIQLTGRFQRTPRLICDGESFPSPVTWQLSTGELIIPASGFDAQLRTLIPDQLTLTVEGRWQFWDGPIGCGKEAIPTDVWYLAVNEIISPSPLARVTLTPSTGVADIGDPDPETTVEEEPVSEPPPASDDPGDIFTGEITPTLAATPPLAPTAVSTEISLPTATNTPFTIVEPDTPTPAGDDREDPTNTPTRPVDATNTPDGGSFTTATNTPTRPADATAIITPTITNTPDPASTPTLTPTVTNTPTPGPSSTPTDTPPPTPTIDSNSPITNVGSISSQELAVGQLRRDQIHSWDFNLTASSALTIMVGAIDNRDLIITLIDPNDTLLVEHNQTGGGQIETLANYDVTEVGSYKVQIRTTDGGDAQYFIMILTSSSYNFSFENILNYGNNVTGNLLPQNDHFWIFSGSADDVICATADPNDEKDIFLELYGPDSNRISAFIDNGDTGEGEELEFTLLNSGIHAIRIGEFNFENAGYSLTLDLGSC